MSKIEYDTVKIPVRLTKLIDDKIDRSEGIYTSRTDLIKQAVRDFIKREDENERKRTFGRNGLDGGQKTSLRTIETSDNKPRNDAVEPGESSERTGDDLEQARREPTQKTVFYNVHDDTSSGTGKKEFDYGLRAKRN